MPLTGGRFDSCPIPQPSRAFCTLAEPGNTRIVRICKLIDALEKVQQARSEKPLPPNGNCKTGQPRPAPGEAIFYSCMEQPNRRGPVGIGTMSVRSRPAPPEISNRRRCAISNQKVTVLPYVSPRCACGRDLPRGRRVKCYFCLPIRRRKINAAAPDSNLTYTLEDRVAQAYAYGLSYGKFMAILHDGGKLPPQLRPIVWPAGSEHAGK